MSVAEIRALVEDYGKHRSARMLDVHRTTIERWLNGVVPVPERALVILRQAVTGQVPGMDGAWQGWRFYKGELCSPAGDSYRPGEVMAIGLQHQRVKALEAQVRELRAEVRRLEQSLGRPTMAAANAARL